MFYDKEENMVGSAEAAEILGVTQSYILRLSRQKKIPAYKYMSRWKYKVSDLQSFITLNLMNPSSANDSETGAHHES